MIRSLFILLSASALLGTTIVEAATSGLIVTFDNIPNRVRHDNPDLAAARVRVKEALGRVNQAGRPGNPEVEAGFEHNSAFEEGKLEVGFSQRFPVTNRLFLEKGISLLEVKAAEAEIREVERRLVAEARSALVDVLAFRQQRRLRQQQVEVANELASFTKESAATGEISPIDAGQAKLEAARLTSEIRQLQAREVAAAGLIKPLLGMKTTDALNVSGALPSATFPRGLADPARRPDFQAAKLNAQAAAQAVDLERARRYDDIEAGLVAGLERSEDAPEGFQNEGVIGFRLKFALPFWDKNEGNIQAAEARAERMDKEMVALAHNIRHEADAARAEMIEWDEILRDISDNLLPLAATQAADANRAYREGLGDLQAVLRAREQELQLGASQIEALQSFHHARVRFEAAVANP
jgi:cobalt-zinc-cadmium efflux system outer membrane protein